MELNEVLFTDSLPTLDLHGYDRASANVKIKEFINDNICMKKEIIAIIHGRGTGVIKDETHRTLKNNKYVLDYKLFYNNVGTTIVKLNVK